MTKTPARRPKIRLRLTFAFGAIAFGSGALIIAALYLFMRFVPTYIMNRTPSVTELRANPPSEVKPALPRDELSSTLQIVDVSSILDTLLWAGIGILLVMTALACWAGWIVSGRMVRPLARIADAARRAGEGRLDHRIALAGPQDEIQDLADTFDRTLDRLERAFSAHERFAANAAHELRTPLTATKTLLDIARSHPEALDPETLVEQIGRNNDRSIGMVQALLELTSVEAARIDTTACDLAETVRDLAARRIPPAYEPDLRLEPVRVQAEPVLLSTLIENLLVNAVRHNDARGVISVSTGADAERSWLRVENTGERLGEAELEKLTEPLYRTQRTAAPGYGLGLAITRSIAEAHGATLGFAARAEGGLIATVVFPVR